MTKDIKILLAENNELRNLMAKKKNLIESQEKEIFDLKNQLACSEINSSIGYVENRLRYYTHRTEFINVLKTAGYVGLGIGIGIGGIKVRNLILLATWRSQMNSMKQDYANKLKFWRRIDFDGSRFKFWVKK